MQGYIKLFRGILQWEWYRDGSTKALFLHLLLKACYKDTRYKGVPVPRGSLAATVKGLSQETGLSVKSVRTALSHLQASGEIEIRATNRFSVIRIRRYGDYQDADGQTADTGRTGRGQAPGKPSEEERKNEKEEKKTYAAFVQMTQEEYRLLEEDAGETGARRCVEILNNFKGASGRQYQSDYWAMRSWVIDCYRDERKKQGDAQEIQYLD